ncbi:aminopeptidase N [Longilinea arvoryzae]|uniref:Aminopeptidase N n=1 Tax=Longilinea arvoryzae TaxID=360412 RepID=A0A0S7BP56_9CHLR|nr:M1 family metallopeptidase [Longilinea arvoryzae]GAP15594.1 aminopeptidase N [Longilinea arvoryzae]
MPKSGWVRLLPFLIVCLLVSGCLPATQSLPRSEPAPTTPAIPPTEILSPSATPSALPETPLPAAPERPHYQIDARLAEDLRTLQVQEEIRLTNPTDAALESLPLVVEANGFAGAFELLKASASNGIEIQEKTIKDNQLKLQLQPALPAGETLTLALEYNLHLPPIRPGESQVFGYTQKQTNLADWYPFLPAFTTEDGWLVHPAAEVGEHTVYPAADFDVQLHLPQLNPALVVAASARAETIADGYAYHVEAARNFTWSASQDYRVSTRQAGPVTVTSYAYPATELQARAALEYTVQAVDYFTKQFAVEPPHTQLSIVQADFPDGMEFDSLYFLSQRFYYGFDGSPRSYLALIAVHETAHQWWYARVGSDQALDPWLDEALCTYSELLFYENLNPELAKWWWGFRVEPYAASGNLSMTIYDFSDFLTYRNSIYLRGVKFLQAVRQTVGDDAFFSALQAYANLNSGRIASSQDLLNTFTASTHLDLGELESEYFQP